MDNPELQIARFLAPFKPEIQTLTQQLRDYLKEKTQPTTELVGDSTISVNIGYGFTAKAWDCYCAIIVYSKHINLSFPSGTSLSDPHSLLQGSGKRIRHFKVKSFEDVQTPELMAILKEARENAFSLLGKNTGKSVPLRTIIKPISGIKKRPNQ